MQTTDPRTPGSPPPVALTFPVEPVEDSADDPVPEDPCGTETDEELEEAIKAEPAPVEDLPPAEKAYRNRRLADRDIYPRLRRRYARAVSDSNDLDDLVQNTFVRAHGAPAFPLAHETIFPWIFKPGSAERKKTIRCIVREKGRFVPLDQVDRYEHVPAPDLDPIPDSLEPHQKVVDDELAADSSGRWNMEVVRQQVVDGVPATVIAAERGVSVDALYQRTSRFKRRLRKALVASLYVAVLCAFTGGTVYLAVHHVAPQDQNVADPNKIPRVPTPAPSAPDPQAQAQKYREQGFKECAARHWDQCAGYLQQAQLLDPSLMSDPEIKKAVDNAVQQANVVRPDDTPHK
jgi:DNA-directed RNA polymerase specialized sigma24 family protein